MRKLPLCPLDLQNSRVSRVSGRVNSHDSRLAALSFTRYSVMASDTKQCLIYITGRDIENIL